MWAFIAASVVYHEFVCPDGELLSEEVDRALAKHPVAVYAFTAVTVSHLLNWLPPKYDPYVGFGFALIQRMKGSPNDPE